MLRNTSVGRKKHLSLYASKRKCKRNAADGKRIKKFKQHYNLIEDATSDEGIEILNSTDENNLSTSYDVDSDCSVVRSLQEKSSHDDISDCRTDDVESNTSNSDIDKYLKELNETDLLRQVLSILDECGHINEFMNLLHLIASKELATDNIVLLLLFERVKFQMCKNTVGMRYSDRTKLFWSILYQICKGSGLKFFSGEKNWGQVARSRL